MIKRLLSLALILVIASAALIGCGNGGDGDKQTGAASGNTAGVSDTESSEPVTLTIAGSWTECRAIDEAARSFRLIYPNCTIVYEYLQDYYASVEKRITGEDPIDVFFTTNIQKESALLPYALDLYSCGELDLSQTFGGLIDNFVFRETGDGSKKLYALPLGAEMRGLYINKTLLDSLDIAIPTNQASLLAACETLKQNGYIPFHGNPGDFSQTLLYPWICNIIANSDDPAATYAKVDAREAGVSELFREPYEFLYTLIENNYYDYKRAQTELDLFNDTTVEAYARYFFNIKQNGDTWEKADDVGIVAFMPSPLSSHSVIEKTKTDYHSNIEYVFVPAPIGEEGGYVYLSPAHGIAVNKDSANIDWSVKFLNFLFQPENNKEFANNFNVIPNTKEAFAYIHTLYELPGNHISHLGQVTFSYGFYDTVTPSMLSLSKANNPKYMIDNGDGTTSLYPLDYYLGLLEESIAGQ